MRLNEGQMSMLICGIVYMGTVAGNRPRVRPMRPYVAQGGIWLVSHADTEKVAELVENNHIELCAANLDGTLLRVAGVAEEESGEEQRAAVYSGVPELETYFAGPQDKKMKVYRLRISEIVQRLPGEGEAKELLFREKQN